jgi:hypothetical protein
VAYILRDMSRRGVAGRVCVQRGVRETVGWWIAVELVNVVWAGLCGRDKAQRSGRGLFAHTSQLFAATPHSSLLPVILSLSDAPHTPISSPSARRAATRQAGLKSDDLPLSLRGNGHELQP